MRMEAARTRRWALLGAPVLLGCAGLGMRAGGGAAGLLGCMMLSMLRGPFRYPYPRRRGLAPQRLFFAWSAGAFLLTVTERCLKALLADPALDALCYMAGVFPACVLCGQLLLWHLPKSRATAGGVVLWALLALILTAGR